METGNGGVTRYTLGEAARAVSRTKPTILRAIRAGKISAVKDEATGAWSIQVAESPSRLPPRNGRGNPGV
jgi:hypothetical protein